MLVSTEIGSFSKIVGERRAVELVAKAGFDAWDFSMFDMARWDWSRGCVLDNGHPLRSCEYLKFSRELAHVGGELGIHCNQSHAPFPVYRPEIYSYIKRAIECTAEAGGKICVIHPDNHAPVEKNAEMYFELLPFAKEHGVKIATENMWSWSKESDCASAAACSHHDDFLAHIKAVDDPDFVACLDIGHAEMKGLGTTAEDMIFTLGKHLQALHIHDNDLWHDSHAIPFSMQIDFEKVVSALKKIGYSGYLTLEASTHCDGCSSEELPQRVKELFEAVDRIRKMF